MPRDEVLPLVDEEGRVIGSAARRDVHGNPTLLHPVVHCLVTNRDGELLLQLRGRHKDVQPGRWDTSVGGHVGLDESIESAVVREIGEELGVRVSYAELVPLYRYLMRNEIESELVHTFLAMHEGPFRAEADEIDELRFWSLSTVDAALGTSVFTPNFEDEFARYRLWRRSSQR